jgi:hypothetical protein
VIARVSSCMSLMCTRWYESEHSLCHVFDMAPHSDSSVAWKPPQERFKPPSGIDMHTLLQCSYVLAGTDVTSGHKRLHQPLAWKVEDIYLPQGQIFLRPSSGCAICSRTAVPKLRP